MRLVALLALTACTAKDGGDTAQPPAFDDVERVVLLADHLAANPDEAHGYAALLAANDDTLFPEFAGRDLATRLPGAQWLRLDGGGASYRGVADDPLPRCDTAPAPCLEPGDARPTLVIIGLGANDLVSLALRLVTNPSLRDDTSGAIADLRAAVVRVLAATDDPELFPSPPLLVVMDVADPSDGEGDLAELVTAFFPLDGAEDVTPELALEVIAQVREAILQEAHAAGAIEVPVYDAFLGHGLHYADGSNPHHDADDPTGWLRNAVEPNLRGAHELRRLLWTALTGEVIDVIPQGLPVDAALDMPTVPGDGWAVAVVDAEITAQIEDDGAEFVNIAADPTRALGAPEGNTSGLVAVGVEGAWMVLDMGGTATDGDGADLVVLEYGAASGGTPEPYRVAVSTAPDGPWTVLGEAWGERAFNLGDVGVTELRYVRIESLAPTRDILDGLGSPYYPGPEIDAVGVVYPGG